jgi:hypothetical protein
MLKANLYAPSFLFSPAARKKINSFRLNTDIIGLGLVYTFSSFIPDSVQWILSIYTIMAWVTILTIDPTRLPDAAATKLNQRRAWKYVFLSIPVYAFVMGVMLFVYEIPGKIHSIPLGEAIGLIVNACMIELYYRNVLQATLRQLGLAVVSSIGLQSIGFALHFFISSHSLMITVGAFIIGLVNGIIVYKTRSIYPNFLVITIWCISIFLAH